MCAYLACSVIRTHRCSSQKRRTLKRVISRRSAISAVQADASATNADYEWHMSSAMDAVEQRYAACCQPLFARLPQSAHQFSEAGNMLLIIRAIHRYTQAQLAAGERARPTVWTTFESELQWWDNRPIWHKCRLFFVAVELFDVRSIAGSAQLQIY